MIDVEQLQGIVELLQGALTTFAQWLLIVFLGLAFFGVVRQDFEGKAPAEPGGFGGFVQTLIAFGIIVGLLWLAGSFDSLAWWL